MEPDCPTSRPTSTADELCDLGQVEYSLCGSVSLSVKGDDGTCLLGLEFRLNEW